MKDKMKAKGTGNSEAEKYRAAHMDKPMEKPKAPGKAKSPTPMKGGKESGAKKVMGETMMKGGKQSSMKKK